MAKRMLIDATHPEETRVVVHNGSRLEEFDYETVSKKQIKGNIYLAKITRVEPSLQAAFVEYGGNRHGFLPFSEIHPDYYRIPIADREALLAEEKALKSSVRIEDDEVIDEPVTDETGNPAATDADNDNAEASAATEAEGETETAPDDGDAPDQDDTVEEIEGETSVDTLSGEDDEEVVARSRASLLRKYKIQEVIKRRQVILVQVAKEERGNKGAALTTYLSLAGRYCVLMPNTNKGGGISRKISNAGDRRRLKEILSELKIPEGIAVIVRTAGSQRNKTEIRRDYEYLMRLWNEIRELTLRSTAPALIHEEANLIKRAIRDLYARDMEDVLVEGEASYKAAKSFMRTLMPSHAKKVQLYKDPSIPLFHRYKVEGQLDAMHNPTVQLKSGGYIVINPTEALVAIDVNSGKATRERHIEETALKTNLEAADEVARQVRLRDLAGLVVVDFIDMEEGRHNRDVERRLKEAMKNDRARIQLGRISPFGLLEMSRQRLRPSLVENSTLICSVCQGVGTVRTTESTALHVLRAVEEEGIRRAGGSLLVSVPTAVALYLLNQKRSRLFEIEQRYDFEIEVAADDSLTAPDYGLERLDDSSEHASDQRSEKPRERRRERATSRDTDDEDLRPDTADGTDGAGSDRKRSRRRRRRKREDESEAVQAEDKQSVLEEEETAEVSEETSQGDSRDDDSSDGDDEDGKSRKRRRRGKRGGRRRSRRRDEDSMTDEARDDVQDGDSQESDDEAAKQPEDESSLVAKASGPEIDTAQQATDGESPGTAEPDTTEPGTTESASAEAEADSDATAAAEAKPKRRRSRSPKRAKSAEAAATDQAREDATSETGATQAAEAVVSEPVAEKPARKRTTRSRAASSRTPKSRTRKQAPDESVEAPTAQAETAVAEQPAAGTHAETPREKQAPDERGQTGKAEPAPVAARKDDSREDSPAQFAPGAHSDTLTQPSVSNDDQEDEDSSEPKRRGWWSRWV